MELSNNLLEKKRDLYWDSVKFMLIFLVVYGHIISPYKTERQLDMAIYNFIYLFHMPLFIFISGRFSHIHDKKRYKQSIWRLIETYVISQTIFSLISYAYIGQFDIDYLITPNWILWYLPALVYWRLMIYFTPLRWIKHRKIVTITSFCISLAAGYIPVGYNFAIHRTLSFLPFFIMGFYSTTFNIRDYIKMVPLTITAAGLLTVFFIIFHSIQNNISFILHCPYNDWEIMMNNAIYYPAIRCIYILMTMMLSIMVMRFAPVNPSLAKWGKNTLFIFIYHALALRLVVFRLIAKSIIPYDEFSLLLYAILITAILLALHRYKPFSIMLNPINYFRERVVRKNYTKIVL